MKKMHKFLFSVVLLCIGSICAAAAEPLSELLGKIAGDKLLKAEFSCFINVKKQTFSSNGTIRYQGGAFYLETEALTLVDNTKDCWTVDAVAKEVTIEASSGLSLLKGASISPLYDANGRLTNIDATLKDGTKASVIIPKLELLPKADIAEFSFDHESLDSSWVITDLR